MLDEHVPIASPLAQLLQTASDPARFRESEAACRAWLDLLPAMTWVAAPSGALLLANEAWFAYTGLPREQNGRGGPRPLLHPDDEARSQALWAEALAAGTPYENELRLRHHDGHYRWVLTRAAPVRDATGAIVGWAGTTIDIHDRKQAEQAVQTNAALLELAHEPIFVWELHGPIITWNRGAERLYGFPREEAIGRISHELLQTVHPEGQAAFLATLERERELSGELQQTTRDGRRVLVATHQQLVMTPGGRLLVLETNRDITARKRAEEALARERELLQSVIDRIPVMITMYEPDAEVLRLNAAFERLVGWSAQDALGTSLMEECYPDPAYREQVREFMESCRDGWMDVRMRTRDGRFIDTSWANVRLSDKTRVGIGIDVSERQRSEEARARLAAIVRYSDDAIVSKDLNGTINSWNSGAERLFGHTAAEAIGQPITIIIPVERLDEEQRILSSIRRGEPIEHFDTVRQRKDGSLLDISLTVSPIRDERGTIIGASKIARDVTERKQLEAARQALEQAREEFLAAAAHDLKTPLTAIKGVAQLQRRRVAALHTPESERLVTALGQIDALVNDAVAQINALLDVVRLQTGEPLTLDRTAVDLVGLAREQVTRHQATSTKHAVRLRTRLDTLVGMWDRQRLERVVGNLLSNAVKYSPQGGPITITLRREAARTGPRAVLSVRDRGLGIPPGEVGRVFEPHFRASNVQGRIPGTGIGLAGTKQIVEQHGGTISVASRQGQETTFTVRLPLALDAGTRDE